MIYQFTRNQILTLVVCLAVLGFLTFSAGVIAGLGLAMPTRQELAMLKAGKPPAIPSGAPPQLPATPAAVGALATKLTAPALPAASAEQPAPAAAPAATAAPPPAPAPQPSNETAAVAPAPAPTPAPAAVAPASAPAAAQTDTEFALQLGSFRDLNHAKQLQTEMKDRGYNTSILTALDADQREWHVVRIDGFKTLAGASQAAAEFIGKERIPAVVRRAKTL
jgi:cell division septation protein DedD